MGELDRSKVHDKKAVYGFTDESKSRHARNDDGVVR